jgi:hypothetical protein
MITSDFKSAWVCPDCSLAQPRQRTCDNTPVRDVSHSQSQTAGDSDNVSLQRGGNRTRGQSPSDDVISSSVLSDIKDLFASEIAKLKYEMKKMIEEAVSRELRKIRDDMTEIKEGMSFINAEFDNMAKKVSKLDIDVKALSSTASDIGALKSSLHSIELRSNEHEQWSRRTNVEIYGVPEKKNENLISLIKDIAHRADFPLDPANDLDFVTRVAPRDKDKSKVKPIVLRFLARYKKDDFLAKVKKMKLKASDIGCNGNNGSIYFNDHLTRANKALLQRAKSLARERNYKYVWVKNCSVFVRRDDTSPVIMIAKDVDLNKIK